MGRFQQRVYPNSVRIPSSSLDKEKQKTKQKTKKKKILKKYSLEERRKTGGKEERKRRKEGLFVRPIIGTIVWGLQRYRIREV